MTTGDRDTDAIRRALQDLRSADEAGALEFEAVLVRKRPVRASDTRNLAALAFAASVMLVCTTTIARIALRPPRLVVPSEVIALSSWRPMTDALLEGSQQTLLRETPRLGESILPVTPIDTTRERR